jgi:hypothetical protein
MEFFWVLLAVTIALGAFYAQDRRARGMVERWAAQNGFQVVEMRYSWLSRGPFFWTSSKEQLVYRLTVRDRYGDQHGAWVRCGSFWLGMWSDKVDVRWDDARAAERSVV